MVNLKNYMVEITLTLISAFWLWLVLTNSNQVLGNTYLWLFAISFSLLIINILIFDKSVRVTFQKEPGKHIEAIFAGLVGWGIVMVASFIIFSIYEPSKANFGSILSILGATTPAFANSIFTNFMTITLAVGYLETTTWARVLEFICDRLNIPINRENMTRISFIITTLVLAIAFAIYHSTSKGITNFPGLALVAIMMFVSLNMVAYFNGETRQAVYTHILLNGSGAIAVLLSGGKLIFG
ncbi:MAG: hypothetical protein AABY22_12160 [Nanoarchaeota archaeon]